MSAGVVFQNALRSLRANPLCEEAMSDLVAVLSVPQGRQVATVLYEAGAEAAMERAELLLRTSALFVAFCAGNLCDDIMDGDVTYLPEPLRMGPSAQYLLQHQAFAMLLDSSVDRRRLREAMLTLVELASYSHLEVRTKVWCESRYRALCFQGGGRQWEAYMHVLWSGTALEGLSAPFANRSAIVAFVADDLRSQDPRYCSMSLSERQSIITWVLKELQELEAMPLKCARDAAAAAGPVLREEATKLFSGTP